MTLYGLDDGSLLAQAPAIKIVITIIISWLIYSEE